MKTNLMSRARPLLVIAAGIMYLSVPMGARAGIATVQLSVTLSEDQTCPCNCSDGHCTFASVLDSVVVTAPSTRAGLRVELVAAPTHAFLNSFQLNDVNGHPNTTLNAGQWTYRPAENYHNTTGNCGPEFFTFIVISQEGEVSGTSRVDIRVTPVNDPPIAANKVTSTNFNAAKAITLSATDADNTDCDTTVNDILTFRRTTNPAHGAVNLNGATATYTPNGTFAGDDSFQYVANDGHTDSTAKTVTIHVIPGLSVGDVTVTEGQTVPLTFTLFPTYGAGRADAKTVTMEWHTVEGSAFGGACPFQVPFVDDFCDAGSIPGFPVTFQPGVGARGGNVSTLGDSCREPNETITVVLTNPSNAFLARGTAICTIRNDDPVCRDVFGNDISCSGFCSVGVGEGIPADAVTQIGEPLNYAVQWIVPDPKNWHSLDTIVLRLSDEDGAILTVLWDEAANTFSLLNPANEKFQRSGLPGSQTRFETRAMTLFLKDSAVTGSGPTGPSVLFDLNLAFKPQAAGHTFTLEALATDDDGNEQGYDPLGTITVLAE